MGDVKVYDVCPFVGRQRRGQARYLVGYLYMTVGGGGGGGESTDVTKYHATFKHRATFKTWCNIWSQCYLDFNPSDLYECKSRWPSV